MYEVLTFYRAGLNKRISAAVTWDSAGFPFLLSGVEVYVMF